LPQSLPQLAAALAKPAYTLYVGRKSCPLALPLQAQVVEASDIREAFRNARFHDARFLEGLTRPGSVEVYWDGDEPSGFKTVHTIERRDAPTSRRRWQFAVRTERYATETALEKQEG